MGRWRGRSALGGICIYIIIIAAMILNSLLGALAHVATSTSILYTRTIDIIEPHHVYTVSTSLSSLPLIIYYSIY